jgi:hypothetical protein
VTGVALSTLTGSNTIAVAGIDAPSTMTVTGGEYQKNGGALASSATTAVVGDNIRLWGISSGSYLTAVNVVLTIGGVSDTFTITTQVDPALTAPVNVVPPAVTGTEEVGETLTCSAGTWTGSAVIVYTYQWFRAITLDGVIVTIDGEMVGEALVGETASTYLVTEGAIANPEGEFFYCEVTATNGVGTAMEQSDPTAQISTSPSLGTPMGMLLAVTKSTSGGIPSTDGGPMGLLLSLTKAA